MVRRYGGAVALVVLLLPGPAAAQPCLTQQAKTALAACPAGKVDASGGKRPRPAFGAAPAEVSPEAPDLGPVPARVALLVRDGRPGVLATRSFLGVANEIQLLEERRRQLPAGSPERAAVLRQLADRYAEAIVAASGPTGRPNAAEFERRARVAAITALDTLRREHATWCVQPSVDPARRSGCLDETTYLLALELERAGRFAEARQAASDLTRGPQTRYAALAFLSLAEMAAAEAGGDRARLASAAPLYGSATQVAGSPLDVWVYARYMQARTTCQMGDSAACLSHLRQALERAAQAPELPAVAMLLPALRRDLVPPFARGADPRVAYDFFRGLSGDAPGEMVRTHDLVEALGRALRALGRHADAAAVFTELRNRDDTRRCRAQALIVEATRAGGDADATGRELERLSEVEAEVRAGAFPDDEKAACTRRTATLIAETATRWHVDAVKAGDVGAMARAGRLHESLLARPNLLAAVEPTGPDRPDEARLRYALAELLYHQRRWTACNVAFEALVSGPLGGHAAHGSALCAVERVGEAIKKNARIAEVEAPAVLAALQRHVCTVKPRGLTASSGVAAVQHARAAALLSLGRDEEAALAAQAQAFGSPKERAALPSAVIYVQALSRLAGGETPRKSCSAQLDLERPKLAGLHCAHPSEQTREACATLSRDAGQAGKKSAFRPAAR